MFSAYTVSNNSTLTQNNLLSAIQDDLINAKTNGYQGKKFRIASTEFGTVLADKYLDLQSSAPFFMRGEKITKMAISSDRQDAHFLLTNGEDKFLTRVGDFKLSYKEKAKNTYIGKPSQLRTYLVSSDGGKFVLGRPIGKGPIRQEKRPRDPLLLEEFPSVNNSPVFEPGRKIGGEVPYSYGPLVPIDLTRGKNGLILDRYSKVKLSKKSGIIEGLKDGLWVPLYKLPLFSVPNPHGLHQIPNSTLKTITEKSGKLIEVNDVDILGEHIEKSNVSEKYSSVVYKMASSALNLAIVMNRNNLEVFRRYLGLLNAQ